MATATIVLHGDLQDFTRLREARFSGEPTLKDVIESIGVPHPEIDLILLDGAASTLETKSRDGMKLELFPAREGPDVQPRLLPPLQENPRFVLDGHLGKLARLLRLLGFDTWWDRNPPDELLAELSAKEDRVLLTRDHGCLKRGIVRRGAFVRSTEQVAQGREVVKRFALKPRPFTRCLSCNGVLVEATAAEASAMVPARVLERHQRFLRCGACGHFYWSGTHHDRLQQLIDRVTAQQSDHSETADRSR